MNIGKLTWVAGSLLIFVALWLFGQGHQTPSFAVFFIGVAAFFIGRVLVWWHR